MEYRPWWVIVECYICSAAALFTKLCKHVSGSDRESRKHGSIEQQPQGHVSGASDNSDSCRNESELRTGVDMYAWLVFKMNLNILAHAGSIKLKGAHWNSSWFLVPYRGGARTEWWWTRVAPVPLHFDNFSESLRCQCGDVWVGIGNFLHRMIYIYIHTRYVTWYIIWFCELELHDPYRSEGSLKGCFLSHGFNSTSFDSEKFFKHLTTRTVQGWFRPIRAAEPVCLEALHRRRWIPADDWRPLLHFLADANPFGWQGTEGFRGAQGRPALFLLLQSQLKRCPNWRLLASRKAHWKECEWLE